MWPHRSEGAVSSSVNHWQQNPDIACRYEAALAKGEGFEYQMELRDFLRDLVGRCDRKIERGRQRLEEIEGSGPVFSKEMQMEIAKLIVEYDKLMAESEKAGEEGNVDEAAALTDRAELLKKKRDELTAKAQEEAGFATALQSITSKQKLRICEVCAASLSLNDSSE